MSEKGDEKGTRAGRNIAKKYQMKQKRNEWRERRSTKTVLLKGLWHTMCEIAIGLVSPVRCFGNIGCLGCFHNAFWRNSQNTEPLGNFFFSVGSTVLFPCQQWKKKVWKAKVTPQAAGKMPNGSLEEVSNTVYVLLSTTQSWTEPNENFKSL